MFSSPQINLYTKDVERLRDFYAHLGFVQTFQFPSSGKALHVELRLDQFVLGIASVDSAIADHGLQPNLNGRPVELVLWTDDTNAEFTRLTAAGAPSLSGPHDWLDGKLRIAWIADPDGNPIQLVQQQGKSE